MYDLESVRRRYELYQTLPVPNRLFELCVVSLGVASGGVETVMPEMIRHQRQIARLVVEPRPGRVPQRVYTLELDLGCAASNLEPFIDRNPRAGRQKIASALVQRNLLERFDQGRREVDPAGLAAFTSNDPEHGTAEVDILPL